MERGEEEWARAAPPLPVLLQEPCSSYLAGADPRKHIGQVRASLGARAQACPLASPFQQTLGLCFPQTQLAFMSVVAAMMSFCGQLTVSAHLQIHPIFMSTYGDMEYMETLQQHDWFVPIVFSGGCWEYFSFRLCTKAIYQIISQQTEDWNLQCPRKAFPVLTSDQGC